MSLNQPEFHSAAPSRRRAPVVFGCILLSLLCGWSALGNFFSFGNRPEPREAAYPVAAGAETHRSPSSDTTATRNIEDVRVGRRVLTGKEGGESSPTAVDPATWRLLTLHSQSKWADGTIDDVHVQTLQPPEWIAEHGARLGAVVPIPLDLVEMGLPEDMTAEVVADEPCPQIESGPGRVVLTTVNHLNRDVHTLTVADTAGNVDNLGVTGFHKFYSLDRSAWVSCKDLHDNEQIRGFPDRRLTVVARSPLPGTHRVYNMTVEVKHVYHVGALGVLAHNNGCAQRVGDVAGDAAEEQVRRNSRGQAIGSDGRFIPDPDNPPSPYRFTDAQRRAAWRRLCEDPNSPLTPAQRAEIEVRGWRGPQRQNELGEWETMELSHEPIPLREGGTEVVPRWPSDHAAIDPDRKLKER